MKCWEWWFAQDYEATVQKKKIMKLDLEDLIIYFEKSVLEPCG